MQTEAPPLELYYADQRLGVVTGPYEDQGTWFGTFDSDLDRLQGSTVDEIRRYIAFSIEWHARLEEGEDPDDGPWRTTFAALIASDQWHTVDIAGNRTQIQGPIFVPSGEVSWELER